ncbi:MAG: OmpA family protein [Pseudomonadaceae bacterium]|nr:OmpA family protein [Pseudomonadaceae bacterium]
MKRLNYRAPALLLAAALLTGCAGSEHSQQELDAARVSFQKVKHDPQVLRSAPLDVVRAGESLTRAEGFSGYWGSSADVSHYAYLSLRFSQIASEHSLLIVNQERLAALEQERQRLQQALRDAKLLSVQQQGQAQDEQMVSLTRTQVDRGLVMTLSDVLFEPAKASLNASANRTLLKLVQFLQLNPRRIVRIEGYADNQGTQAQNLLLSVERAQEVANVLEDLGIDKKRLQVQGYGEAYPLAENASRRGREQNRRVEIVFSDDQGNLSPAR